MTKRQRVKAQSQHNTMDSSRGVASRTRSRTRLSQQTNSSKNDVNSDHDDVFLEEGVIYLGNNYSDSSQDGFQYLSESSGKSHESRISCGITKISEAEFKKRKIYYTPMEIEPESRNRYELRKRKRKQKPREVEVEKITEADFGNSGEHDHEEVIEIDRESSGTRHDHAEEEIEVEKIIEAEFEEFTQPHQDTNVELSVSGSAGGCSAKGEEDQEDMNEVEDNGDDINEELAPPLVVETENRTSSDDTDSLFSSSSESEDDDSDDDNFTIGHSEDSENTDMSSLFVEESDEHGSEEAEFSDSNDEEVCNNEENFVKENSKISFDASDKGNEDEAQVEVEELGGNSDERTKIHHDGLENGGRSKTGDVPTVKTGETEDDLISKTGEEYDLLIPSRMQKGCGEMLQKQGITKFPTTKKDKEWISEDEAQVEVRENDGERSARNHDGLKNGVRSQTDDMLLSKTEEKEKISKTGEAQNLKASKIRKTEELPTPNRNQKGSSKIPQRQGKRNFSSTEKGKKVCIDESERNTERKVDVMEDNRSPIHQGGFLGSKPHKTTELSSQEKEENEDGDRTPRNEHLPRKCASPRKDHNFCEKLLDSVLVDEIHEEAKQSSDHEDSLPLKFRFEDEVPKPIEKSEFEIMNEGLFAEMELCLMYGDMDLSEYQKEVEKYDNTNSEDAETTQYAMCCKGKHYLIQDDENGLSCLYCLHVELEAKDIMPPWVERTCHGTDKTSPISDPSSSVLNELNMQPGANPKNSCIPSEGTIWDIKPGMKQTMYQHQQEGLEFLWKNLAGTINLADVKKTAEHSRSIGGCIISHAPGTGKTRLTMVFIETFLKLFPSCRPLIIAPAGMLLTWEEEFKKWEVEFPFHNLNNLEISDKEDKVVFENFGDGKSLTLDAVRHLKIYSWNKGESILGMSYRLFEILAGKKSKSENLKRILLEKPCLIVLDEGHTPRSKKSNIWNALLELKTEKRIILSGTPFQNNFQELFNILRIVRPQIAGDLEKETIFAEMIRYKRSHQNADASNHEIEELKKVMAPFVHVHKGTILQQSLPGLRDCVVLLDPPPLQKGLIERLEKLQGANTFNFDFKVALISVHPYLSKDCQTTNKEKEGVDQEALEASKLHPTEGVKTRFLMELVRLSAMRNEKVLVFSQYIKPLALIHLHLEKTFGWTKGKHILTMVGKMGQKTRQELINSFNDPNSEAKVLLASTKCCSEGINLVGASRVVLLDVVWNPSVERQAISRAYRLGQKKIVYTYHLMTKGTTEGDKYCRQAEKERLSELVFTSSSNENCKMQNCDDVGIEDGVLEDMVDDVKMKDVLEKIIYQPKEQNLIETFSVAGS